MAVKRRFALYLLPTIWRVGIGFATLPLTTFKLDPNDFGVFALVLSLSSFSAGASGLGAAYPLSMHLPKLDTEGQRDLVSTLLWISFGIGLIFAAAIVLGWPALVSLIPDLAQASESGKWIAASLILLGVPWNHATALMTVTGRAGAFAMVSVGESIASTGGTLIALYGFGLGVESLFIGALAAAVVNAVGSLVSMRNLARVRIKRAWISECLHVGGLSFVSALLERGKITIERYALARYAGVADLGLYSHSQIYHTMMAAGVNAVSSAAWPVALEEARGPEKAFVRLGQIWPPTHLAMALGGVFMATLGQDAIALLTHDKFTSAYVLATLWIGIALVQNSSKPALAIVYAMGHGVANQRIIIGSMLVAVVLMIPLVIWFGVYGALAAAALQAVVYRALLWRLAGRIAVLPFQDGTAFVGVAVTLAALVAAMTLGHSLPARGAIMVVASAAMLVICRNVWIPLVGLVFRLVRPSTP